MSDYTPTTEEVRTDYVVAYTNAESSQLLAGMAFDRWLAQHDAEVAANTTLGIAHRLDTDDPHVGEQLVQFEDEWRKEARGEKGGAA